MTAIKRRHAHLTAQHWLAAVFIFTTSATTFAFGLDMFFFWEHGSVYKDFSGVEKWLVGFTAVSGLAGPVIAIVSAGIAWYSDSNFDPSTVITRTLIAGTWMVGLGALGLYWVEEPRLFGLLIFIAINLYWSFRFRKRGDLS